MTEHSHFVGITTKVGNIVMDPRQCLNLQRKCTLSVSYRGERLVLFTQSLTLLLWWDFSLLFVKKEREVKYRIYWNKRLPHSPPRPTQTQIRDHPYPLSSYHPRKKIEQLLEDGAFFRVFYRNLASLHLCALLQNKHTTLADNGENLIRAQPRISVHSQGPKGLQMASF